MEPLLLGKTSRHRGELTDLAVDLVALSTGFRRSLLSGLIVSWGNLVRSMNCYYSNLIEGHDTHPVDIEPALKREYSTDLRQRNLQHEALAHISVQERIDAGGLTGPGRAVDAERLSEIHKRFFELLPEELLWTANPETGFGCG